MKVNDLTIEVRNGSFGRVGQLLPQDLVGFTAVLRFNNVGSWKIELPADHLLVDALRAPSAGIIVTLPNGYTFSGPMTSAKRVQTQDNPLGVWEISGVDDSVILSERLAYPTPSTADVTAQTNEFDTRTGTASTVLYDLVKANIGVNAPAARKITNLTTAADTSIGSTITAKARFDKIGELFTKLAVIDGLGFDIRQTGSNLLFEVFQPVDRSASVRMDIDNNHLSKTEYTVTAPAITRTIVAGSGAGASRTFVEVAASSEESSWARRIETFIDQRSSTDSGELTQAGTQALNEKGLTLEAISVTPTDDETMEFGVDWGLGDKVSVVVGDIVITKIVTEVGLLISDDGVRIGATVGDPSTADEGSTVVDVQQDQETRISNLERNTTDSAGGGGITEPVDSLQWNTAFSGGSTAPAMVAWNDLDGTLEFQLKGGNVTLQIGQEQVIRVKNNSGATINNGSAVYISSSDGTNFNITKALASGEGSSAQTLGVLTESIANGGHGYVTTFGLVRNIDTSALTEGAMVFLSPSTAGGLTSTKPSAPNHLVYVGYCLRSHAVNGVVFVKVQNGYELDELHDVSITSPASGHVLQRNGSNLWVNRSLADAGIVATSDSRLTDARTPTDNSVTTAKIVDAAVTNAKLANSSVTINGSSVSLGGSVTISGTGPYAMAQGSVSITPTANTPTSATVTFPTGRFSVTPYGYASPNTTVIGSTVQGVAVSGISTTGMSVWVYRSNTTSTIVYWQAIQMTSTTAAG